MASEREARTRQRRIDPEFTCAGWPPVKFDPDELLDRLDRRAIREYPPESGPADCVQVLGGHLLGVIEAKSRAFPP